jgi:hypothetical protein|tara:strand:- start:1297 stop:1965 length:669 start_codon:yes stop_codon:yes gene_type:complete
MRARASPVGARAMGAPTRGAARAPRATLPELDARADARPIRPRHLVANEIIVVDDALTARDCARIVDAIGDDFAASSSRGPRHGEARRRNGRFAETSEAFARRLYERANVAATFGFEIDDAVGLNPNIRVYRYRAREHFGAHVDERVTALGRRSKYTALFYLSEDVEGGSTIFYDEVGEERCRVRPKIGRALYFRHGADMPEHEGEEVREGTKYVLRSDVLF